MPIAAVGSVTTVRPGRASAEDAEPAPGHEVLLVDDEDCLLLPMAHYFEGMGWRVVTARAPADAYALLETRRFNLIVLDLALSRSGMEGLDILRCIRRGGTGTPVVVLSGLVNPELEAVALQQGANAVLVKPQRLMDLARVARPLMGIAE
jgi:two-component system, NtrC family, nitrogen regulation response regulator NtrX